MSDMPDDLSELHRKLRSVSFAPRASFEPELLGRLRRRDEPYGGSLRHPRRHLLSAAIALFGVAVLVGVARLVPGWWGDAVTVDRCCYDLDGGGAADDGVLVLAQRDDRVHRLRIYEDLDSSRSYTAGDLVRLDRGRKPAILSAGNDRGVVTIKRCCLDFDGGGPDDDGLLVIGVPPDRVLMAAIYETGSNAAGRGSEGWLLR
jgi:hypothetical protein